MVSQQDMSSKKLYVLFNLSPQVLQFGVHVSCLNQIHLLLQLPTSNRNKQSSVINSKNSVFTLKTYLKNQMQELHRRACLHTLR